MQTVLMIFQIFLAFANSCILIFAFIRLLGKPHSTLEQRVNVLEKRVEKLEERSDDYDVRFLKIEKALTVLIYSNLSLIDFEMQYCLTEHKEMSDSLKESKKALQNYLSEM